MCFVRSRMNIMRFLEFFKESGRFKKNSYKKFIKTYSTKISAFSWVRNALLQLFRILQKKSTPPFEELPASS